MSIYPEIIRPTASDPAVGSRDSLAATLKSRNGDTLKELNALDAEITVLLDKARGRLHEEELKLQPLQESVERLDGLRMNIRCRLNIWWNENREKYEAANKEAHE